ncbi:MAG TPA: hypothetical protein PLY47_08115 [Rhodoglobus sp.]|nr:hypothetical protein [Rhodoglobus sp.]
MKLVIALRAVTPEGLAHQRVDAVGANEHVELLDTAIGEAESHSGLILVEAVDLLVQAEHSVGQGREHPPIELGTQHADEAATVLVDHRLRKVDDRAHLAVGATELRLAGSPELLGVDAHESECLDGRRPEVEDVASRAGLFVALEEHDLMLGLREGEGRGHARGAGADDGDALAG